MEELNRAKKSMDSLLRVNDIDSQTILLKMNELSTKIEKLKEQIAEQDAVLKRSNEWLAAMTGSNLPFDVHQYQQICEFMEITENRKKQLKNALKLKEKEKEKQLGLLAQLKKEAQAFERKREQTNQNIAKEVATKTNLELEEIWLSRNC